jgi:hypothetical protein
MKGIPGTILLLVTAIFLTGCGPAVRPSRGSGEVGGDIRTSPPEPTSAPLSITTPASPHQTRACTGQRIGTYAWSQSYWRSSDSSLLDFLTSALGREWACGDLTINVGDFTNPEKIHDSSYLVKFAQDYHSRVANADTVLWLSYGDVVSKNGSSMLEFTRTFFKWVVSIPSDVAVSMGRIGISYDVEHVDPEYTRQVLILASELRKAAPFPEGSILIQHTIEGANNVVGTDHVMRYADSALAMVYRNYMNDTTGKYHEDSNIANRLLWMLSEQCPNCLNDSFAAAHYKAKITVMVEASCKMGAGCGKLSFCSFDGPHEGAYRVVDIMKEMKSVLLARGSITPAQYERLFSTTTPYATHHWEWFRCFAPFSSSFVYPNCSEYHTLAASCRTQ